MRFFTIVVTSLFFALLGFNVEAKPKNKKVKHTASKIEKKKWNGLIFIPNKQKAGKRVKIYLINYDPSNKKLPGGFEILGKLRKTDKKGVLVVDESPFGRGNARIILSNPDDPIIEYIIKKCHAFMGPVQVEYGVHDLDILMGGYIGTMYDSNPRNGGFFKTEGDCKNVIVYPKSLIHKKLKQKKPKGVE